MMPTRIAIFLVVQSLACVFAFRRGGAPERWTAILMAAATAGTALLPHWPSRFASVAVGVLAIDALMLAALVALAARADRFWPLWIAALQLLAITIHGVRAYDPDLLPVVYSHAVGEVAYPMIALLVAGTWRHWDRVLSRGPERDWSPLVWR